MDYSSAIAISSAGMQVERARLDVSAINIANAHTTRGVNGGPYVPLVALARSGKSFLKTYEALQQHRSMPEVNVIRQTQSVPRMVFEPAHPDANVDGFVAYPGVDTVKEMVNMMTAVRAYEANVVAINAAKSMAMKAIDLGNGA
ncbi:flagellar basal-body rod protein FlgC [Methylophilaceae bacterium 11]|nr:flagellar basal-body rod protein FlgC [Methylophilaceae bacterium 11]